MDRRTEDLRVLRTHTLLLRALSDLLQEKPFDEIRVKDLCQRAMVHRSTFYAHFEDKRHLLIFGMQAFLDDLTDGMPCSDNPAPFRQAIEKVFQYFLARRQEYARSSWTPATPKPRRFSGRSLPGCSPSRPCTTPPSLPTPGRRSWCSANSLPGGCCL